MDLRNHVENKVCPIAATANPFSISGIQLRPNQVPIPKRRISENLEYLDLSQKAENLEKTLGFDEPEHLLCIAQKCRKGRSLAHAKNVHGLCKNELESGSDLGNYIVPMMVDCGGIFGAHLVFNTLLFSNEHSWTSLVVGYVESGQSKHAFSLYHKMQENHIYPTAHTFMILLRACASLKDMERGRYIHVEVTEKGFGRNLFVLSSLIDMYTKCGSLAEAHEVFNKLPARDVVLWSVLIGGYAEAGVGHEALKCFEQMQAEGVSPNAITFVFILKACASLRAINKGRELHTWIQQEGFGQDFYLQHTLVDMYAKCGSLAEAQQAFDKMPIRNVVSWTTLIAGYANYGSGLEALQCFKQMEQEGICPNNVTYIFALKACDSKEAIRQIHTQILQKGCERDLFVGSTLVDTYAKLGLLIEAQKVFGKLPLRNIVSWNALISGFAENGLGEDALQCFEQMQLEGIFPDSVTFLSVLRACKDMEAINKGRQLHAFAARTGSGRDKFVANALIEMYAKCGSLAEAEEVFNKLQKRDVISWTVLIAGYTEFGFCEKALNYVEQMQLDGISPDAFTLIYALKACGNLGAVNKGQEIYSLLAEKGLGNDSYVGSTLIDMYAKCGVITKAYQVFDNFLIMDVVLWNSMIRGYGMSCGNMAVDCFKDMQELGVKPNSTTFICLLNACSHGNLISKGRNYFKRMTEEFGIAATMDHYSCMVDLLARAGHLYVAEKLLQTAPCTPCKEMWTALLSACNTYGEADLGLRCFQQLTQMDPQNAASYRLMENIYAYTGPACDSIL